MLSRWPTGGFNFFAISTEPDDTFALADGWLEWSLSFSSTWKSPKPPSLQNSKPQQAQQEEVKRTHRRS
jgi:hypothetical protein